MKTNSKKYSEFLLLASCFRPAFSLFQRNDPLRMAAATAFFTTFALPPIVFILARLFGVFIGRRNMGRGLTDTISDTLGKDGADLVIQVIRGIRALGDSWYMIIFGFLFLLFVATTLFTVIKNSFDQIWQISLKPHQGILFMLSLRLKSLAVIILAGALFFADLLFESLQLMAGGYIDEIWQGGGAYFTGIVNELVSIFIVSSWFVLLFRFLADGRPTWKASIAGGLLTGTLFIAGRLLLRFLLIDSNISKIYGPSGSMVLVLLFVFYSSFILYYGASFIAVYSEKKLKPVTPHRKAYSYKIEAL